MKNREIKFRAFDCDSKKMHTFNGNGVFEGDWMIDFHGNIWERHEGTGGDFIPDNVELMQFTGMKDKHGTEIYQSDIVKFDNTLMVCCWIEDKCQFQLIQMVWREFHDISSECEIIGNIYENPELLISPK